MDRIVVGVDGSAAASEALRFAIGEARTRGAEVQAVSAWHIPLMAYEVGAAAAAAQFDLGAYRELAESTLARTLEEVGAANSGVKVTAVVSKGQPADVLCACAEGAALLVVGSRGLGGFRGLLLGSVSQQCAQHAPCPVVIVPHATPPAGGETP